MGCGRFRARPARSPNKAALADNSMNRALAGNGCDVTDDVFADLVAKEVKNGGCE